MPFSLCCFRKKSLFHHCLYCREFIETEYVQIKQNNPNFPILIRECRDIQPRVWARYGMYQYDSEKAVNCNMQLSIYGVMCRMVIVY